MSRPRALENIRQRGDLAIGLRLLRAGFDEPGAAGSVPRFFMSLMAEALGRAGQIADGFAAIEEAIVRSERTEERWRTAEFLRIKGVKHFALAGESLGSGLSRTIPSKHCRHPTKASSHCPFPINLFL